jgi:hypothetical protein
MDKLDPIVATWRYIHHLRGQPSFQIEEYLKACGTSSENPKVAKAIDENVTDKRLLQLVKQLQTPDLARYFAEPAFLDRRRLALPAGVLRRLIEGRSFDFVSVRKTRNPLSPGRRERGRVRGGVTRPGSRSPLPPA